MPGGHPWVLGTPQPPPPPRLTAAVSPLPGGARRGSAPPPRGPGGRSTHPEPRHRGSCCSRVLPRRIWVGGGVLLGTPPTPTHPTHRSLDIPVRAGCRQQDQRVARKAPGWQVGSMVWLVLLACRSAHSHCHSSCAPCGDTGWGWHPAGVPPRGARGHGSTPQHPQRGGTAGTASGGLMAEGSGLEMGGRWHCGGGDGSPVVPVWTGMVPQYTQYRQGWYPSDPSIDRAGFPMALI